VLSKLRSVLLILRNPIISAVRGFVGVCVSAAVVFLARGHVVISTDQEAILDTAVFALVMAAYVFAVNAAAKRWPWVALLLGTPHTADYQRRRRPLKQARSAQLGQRVVFGRLKEHDPRSRNFPAPLAGELVSITHRHYGGPLDQGNLGSCTGNAITDACMTSPLRHRAAILTERDALQAYGLATQLDGFPGTYPPDDTGSSGLAACKAAKQLGWIDSYAHAFGLDQVLRALVLGPVIIGVGWREGMMDTDSRGYVHAVGSVVGGHEVCLVGIDVPRRLISERSWVVSDHVGTDEGPRYLTVGALRFVLRMRGRGLRPCWPYGTRWSPGRVPSRRP
jgi:hypothetical protein